MVFQGLELKGQMVYCPESDSVLFIGSPFLDGLEGLTGSGLFISDIPLHDATRDVILVGEQARAQVKIYFIATITHLQFSVGLFKSLLKMVSISDNRIVDGTSKPRLS